jgi:hypothetical protein
MAPSAPNLVQKKKEMQADQWRSQDVAAAVNLMRGRRWRRRKGCSITGIQVGGSGLGEWSERLGRWRSGLWVKFLISEGLKNKMFITFYSPSQNVRRS